MERTTVYFPSELANALRKKARRTGRSQAELIRSALADSLKDEIAEMPRSFGIAESGRIGARHIEEWLDENWKRD